MKDRKRLSACAFIVLIAIVSAGCQAAYELAANEHQEIVCADNLIINADKDEEHDVNEDSEYKKDYELVLTDEEHDGFEKDYELTLIDEEHDEIEANEYEEHELAFAPDYEEDFFWTWDRAELLSMQDINTPDDINKNEFFSNPQLSIEKNMEIKEGVISILLYLFGHDVEEEDVFSVIDLCASVELWAREDGWTMLDETRFLREASLRDEERLSSIDTNFMMRLHQYEDGQLRVSVLIFPTRRGEPGGYLTYSLRFENMEGKYKLVWLGASS